MIVVFVVAGCTGGSGSAPATTASAGPSAGTSATSAVTTEITLTGLGIDDWPEPSAVAIPAPPARPESLGEEQYRQMTDAVRTWAIQAVTTPSTVGEGLPAGLPDLIASSAAGQTAPGLAKGNVLAPDLDLRGTRMTAAWDVTTTKQGVSVTLQTRAAYEVQAAGEPVRVVAVLRTQGAVAQPGASRWGIASGWQEFGASDCAAAIEDVLRPGGDADDQAEDLAVFVRVGEGSTAQTPELPSEQKVDEDFAERCRAGSA